MKFQNVAIESIAHEEAPHVVTSEELEDQISETMARLEIEKGRLMGPTGIRERHFFDLDDQPSEVATRAAVKAIDKAGIDPQRIGCLINTSIAKDYLEPSVACLVHGNLKLSARCINFDITNACLGFLNGMNTIAFMIEAGEIDYGLVVSGEHTREVVETTIKRLQSPTVTLDDFYNNFATLTIGSGGVAMVLSRKDLSRSGHLLEGSVNMAASEHNRLCVAQREYMKTDSRTLLSAGAELIFNTWKLAYETFPGFGNGGIDIYLPHQVSKKQINTFAQLMGLDLNQIYLILERFGNMASAALPSAISYAAENGRLKSGDRAALIGVGSGLNCSIMKVAW
ncbi:MAG: 3-oxoacyl-ACP synthase III [Chloroflexota bacterium]|jgi:3-oxoacyl-[acyl-carrier-protein] synthase-3